MASNKRTIYLGLDYTNFTGGVSEVNRKMGLLDAEFKLAQEQAKNYGNETDQLGLKQDYLRQKIALQTKKVEEAEKKWSELYEAKETNAKKIDAVEKKLIQEKTALEKLNGQLKDADEATVNLNKSTESFGDYIRGLANDLGINVSPAVEKLASKFDGVSKEMGTAIIGIGAIITGFVSCSIEAANFADDLLTLSSTTGITTDELQKMQYASKFLDVEVSTITDSITKLTRNMYSANNGSKEMQKAFQALKIRITDSNGALLDSNEVFYKIIDRLGEMKNETQRDALAMQLLGKSAKELNPLIEAGSKRLKELGIEAEDMGTIMSGESLEKLGKLKDAMDKFENTTSALKNSLGLALLPVLTGLFTAISAIPTPVLQTLVVLASVIASIMLVVKAIKSLTDTGNAIKGFFTGVNPQALKTTAIILGVVAALIALATIIAVIMGRSNDLQHSMTSIGDNVAQMGNITAKAQNGVYTASNHAFGTTHYKGGRTWINEGEPEIVTLPSGTQITPMSESGSVGDIINIDKIIIDAHNVDEFNRVVELAKRQKVAVRRA